MTGAKPICDMFWRLLIAVLYTGLGALLLLLT